MSVLGTKPFSSVRPISVQETLKALIVHVHLCIQMDCVQVFMSIWQLEGSPGEHSPGVLFACLVLRLSFHPFEDSQPEHLGIQESASPPQSWGYTRITTPGLLHGFWRWNSGPHGECFTD